MHTTRPYTRRGFLGGAAALAGALAGCTSGETDGSGGGNEGGSSTVPGARPETLLTDVLTGETLTIGGFETPVVRETFAVWCPICTTQQRQLGALREELGDAVTVVSLNIDPNEDVRTVRNHAREHGFDWRYVVAPVSLTRALTDAFGSTITSAPAAPVVVFCPDRTATFFSRGGVERADMLASQVEAW